jgi:predicted DNA-binding transcriptional regulator YafY
VTPVCHHLSVNRTDRLYALAEELRAAEGRPRTAAWLAERFEVTVRTVKRDVSALQQAGTPVWSTAGPGGGYGLDPAATLPPLTFTPGEAAAIAVALSARSSLPFGPDGRSALTKVLGAMPEAPRRAAEELAGRVWIRDGGAREPVARAIDEALRANRVLVIDYADAQGRRTERRPVEPMALALERDQAYLLAWCRRRRAGRWFRLDRISAAHVTTEAAPARDVAEVFGPIPEGVGPVRVS